MTNGFIWGFLLGGFFMFWLMIVVPKWVNKQQSSDENKQ